MSIYSIALVWLLLAIVFGCKKPVLSLPFLVSLQLLIPNAIKFNVGINLNVFNLSVLAFVLLSLRLIQRCRPISLPIKTYLKGYFVYVCLYSLMVSFEYFTFGEYVQNMILFFFEYIGMAYCLNYVRFDEKSIKYFNLSIVISSFIIIVYGIFNYVVKVNPYMMYVSTITELDVDMANAFMEEQRGFLDGRISSTFAHPLQLGQAALLLFSYIMYELKGRLNVMVYMVVLIGLMIMCVLCGSRSAVFPLVISIYFYLRAVKIRQKVLYIILAVSVFSFSYLSLPYSTQKTLKAMFFVWDEKASSQADIRGSSISGRTDQYMTALRLTKENFLFGYGNGYVAKYGHNHPEMYGYESFVLKELVDGGLLGLGAFILFYILVYCAMLRCAVTPLERGRMHSLCCSFFISAFLTGVSYSFFSLYMTLCMVSYHRCVNRRTRILNSGGI